MLLIKLMLAASHAYIAFFHRCGRALSSIRHRRWPDGGEGTPPTASSTPVECGIRSGVHSSLLLHMPCYLARW